MSAHNLLEELNNMVAPGGGKIFVIEAAAPVNSIAGFSTGCLHIDTSAGDNTAFTMNVGSVTSSDFNLITVA